MIPELLAPIANHLWQSTLFGVAAALAAVALRRNRASLRYALWLAASVKFLVPFSLLVAIGAQLEWETPPGAEPWPLVTTVQEIGYPLARPAEALALPATPATVAPASAFGGVAAVLAAVWLCGSIAVASWWIRGWRLLRSVMRGASPVPLDIPIKALSCPGHVEPGVVGIFRPVLLLPSGIADRLTPAQFHAILVHELCHVRRRDNLGAAIHMAVEILFWFHPLVWWIGNRLVAERERACDEEVLRVCGEPEAYAEGILNVCRLYRESPLACVSGVSGSSLRARIEDIMRNRAIHSLSWGGRLLLASAALAAIAGPVAIGASTSRHPASSAVASPPASDRRLIEDERPNAAQTTQAPVSSSQAPATQEPRTPSQNAAGASERFEVASVRPTRFTSGSGGRSAGAGTGGRNSPRPAEDPCGDHPNSFFAKFDPSRATIDDMTAYGLIAWAYDLSCRPMKGAHLLAGGPGWVRTDGYDIQAVIPAGPPVYTDRQLDAGRGRTFTQQTMTPRFRAMLRTLLEERFKLVLRRETRDLPVYVLTVAPGGAKTAAWKEGDPTTVMEFQDRLVREGTFLTPEQMAALGLSAAEVKELHDSNPRELERRMYRSASAAGEAPADIAGVRMTMAEMIDQIARGILPEDARPIIDRTGLMDRYNFRVRFNRRMDPGAPGPSVFTALEQELGLKLEPGTAPMEVLVIERAERPTEN